MKFFKLFLIFSFLQVLSLQVRAQGNLQFNQVLTFTQNFTGSYGGTPNVYSYSGPSFTVPSGKVWKVEKFSVNGGNNGSGMRINSIHAVGSGDAAGTVWLKANDEIKAYSSCYSCTSLSGSFFFSIIEFNVVP